ncbi:helix-turn-helix domain-containing protein [Streptomyces iranensis]|uniref:helix-turn-helix domain-containing protein n=1 Tax=Streptomyces iranensis TaxID=576784 RepID=UPI0039B7828C
MWRIKTLIGRRFHKSYTIQGIAALLKRHGWSCQAPARLAVERDEAAVADWMKETPATRGMPRRRSELAARWKESGPSTAGPLRPTVRSPAPEDLVAAVRQGLRQVHCHGGVLDGCLTGTRLAPLTSRFASQLLNVSPSSTDRVQERISRRCSALPWSARHANG